MGNGDIGGFMNIIQTTFEERTFLSFQKHKPSITFISFGANESDNRRTGEATTRQPP